MSEQIIIGFSRPRGWFKPFSWLIRLIELTSYSHVYVRLQTSHGVDLIYQASGVQLNFMGIKHFNHHAKILEEYEFSISLENKNKFFKWAITESGAPYSVSETLGIGLAEILHLDRNPISHSENLWVCSQLGGFVLSEFIGRIIPSTQIEKAGPKAINLLCQKYGKLISKKAIDNV